MTKPAPGEFAPDFELITDKGEVFRLSFFRGNPVVLFFYPEDDTPGCTIENLEFSLLAQEFEKLGAKLVGISPDSVKKHCDFRDKFNLAVTLAADPEHKAINAFGLWGPKVSFGRHIVGLTRATVLINADGTIAQNFLARPIKGHAAKVLEATRMLVAGG
jgi:peroxiredoxin Q/BCP